MKYFACHYGNGLAIGLEGAPEEIENEFNKYVNLKILIIKSRLHWMSENFAYFLCTFDNFKKGLKKFFVYEGVEKVNQAVKTRIKNLIWENFIKPPNYITDWYKVHRDMEDDEAGDKRVLRYMNENRL